MRYRLPPKYRVMEFPKGEVIRSEHLFFQQRVSPTEDGFVVDEDTMLLFRRLPVGDYPDFREAALAADAQMKRKVRILGPNAEPGS